METVACCLHCRRGFLSRGGVTMHVKKHEVRGVRRGRPWGVQGARLERFIPER